MVLAVRHGCLPAPVGFRNLRAERPGDGDNDHDRPHDGGGGDGQQPGGLSGGPVQRHRAGRPRPARHLRDQHGVRVVLVSPTQPASQATHVRAGL